MPIVNAMTAIDPSYQVINPDPATFSDPDALLDWAYGAYAHSHHFAGTCKMGALADGGVVDSNGHVHGVSKLWVADVSIWPIKASRVAPVMAHWNSTRMLMNSSNRPKPFSNLFALSLSILSTPYAG